MRNVKGLEPYKELEQLLSRMNSIIFVPTCPSSGTWFVLDLLEAHDKINTVILAAHWSDRFIEKLNGQGLLEDDGIVALQSHFKENAKRDVLMQKLFSISDYIVTPIRNPLRSLLTAYVKQGVAIKHFPHPYIRNDSPQIIQGCIELAELIKKHNIFIVPVDLYLGKSRSERYFLLRDLFDFLQLPYNQYMKELANTWHKSNTMGKREESVGLLFDTKNIERIKQIIPQGYDALIQSKDILKPFFESQGYPKEDLWWW